MAGTRSFPSAVSDRLDLNATSAPLSDEQQFSPHFHTPMPKRKAPSWTPASSFTVTKLKPNGPKPGQSAEAFIYGKDRSFQRLVDNPNTKFNDLP
jgi:hypothetical protein